MRRITRRSLLDVTAVGLSGGALLLVLGRAEALQNTAAQRENARGRRRTGLRDLDAGQAADPEGYGRGPSNCLDYDPADPANIARCPRKPRRR